MHIDLHMPVLITSDIKVTVSDFHSHLLFVPGLDGNRLLDGKILPGPDFVVDEDFHLY